MKDHTTAEMMYAIGVDVSDDYCYVCIVNMDDGTVLERTRISNTPGAFNRCFKNLEPSRVAIEVGMHSPWMSRELIKRGHQVWIGNPRKVRLIYQTDKKNDWVDAENLARLVRVDPKLLYPVIHRPEEAQEHLEIIKARDLCVRSRTNLINHVRGVVKPSGVKLPRCSTDSFSKQVELFIPPGLRPALTPLLKVISELTSAIKGYDRQIDQLAKKVYPEVELLTQVKGVGNLTALAYRLVIFDPSRFPKSRKVGPYLGLGPRLDQSGVSNPQLPITKAGNQFLRRLLVNCAQYILGNFGQDCDLRRWGLAKAQGSKAAKKRAVVGVARKLAVLLHRLWVTGEEYEPLHNVPQDAELPVAA